MTRWHFPWMLRRDHEAVRRENGFLREAMKEANKELLKHRRLISGLKDGTIDIISRLEKIK